MLSERDIDAAHPDAFDLVFGNLAAANLASFNRHLSGCRYCQAVVDEYSEIGGIIQQLPPHVDPPAELEDRIVAAMVTAQTERTQLEAEPGAEDQRATRIYPAPEVHHSAEPETQAQPVLQLRSPAEDNSRVRPSPAGEQAPVETVSRPTVTRLPVWRRHRARLVSVLAAAAAVIIAAAIAIPRLAGGQGVPAQTTVVIPLHATTAAKLIGDGAATGQATAHQACPSWTFQMTVHGLKVLPGNNVYQCWWVGPGSNKTHPQLVSGGTFVVDNSGSTTVTMTTGVDPRDFRTMEVTAEPPGTGALTGPVLLTSQTL